MDTICSIARKLINHISGYFDSQLKLIKLSAADIVARVAGGMLTGMVIALCFSFFLLFASASLAFVIGGWVGSTAIGFLLVAALYLVISMMVWVARNRLIRFPIMNALINEMSKKDIDETDPHHRGAGA